MDKVLHWLKNNVPIVVLGAVIVVAPILAFVFAARWNSAIREESQNRARKLTEIESVTKTNVQLVIPGAEPIAFSGVVNQYVLDEYKRVTEALQGDSSAVRELALAHNRGQHHPFIPRLFPQMPWVERDTIRPEMYDAVVAGYRNLLDRVQAAWPIPPEQVASHVARREEDYIAATLRKKNRSELEPSELADLTRELTKARLAKYGELTLSKRVYAGLESLPLPPLALKASASEGEMFVWQWNYWVVEDILLALDDANRTVAGPEGRIATNPVKQVLSIRLLDGLSFGGTGQPGMDAGTGPAGGRRVPRFGEMGVGGSLPPPGEDGGFAGEGGAAPASGDSNRDFKASITGRVTNPLYDVRLAEVRLIANMERIPAIIDALTRRNFMAVIDLDMRPADPFAAAAHGFIYGSDPVAEVTMVVETIWLREWTVPLMPTQVKERLGVAAPSGNTEAPPLESE